MIVTRRSWTAADDARMRALAAGGMEWPEIAAEIGRTPGAVRNRASDTGVRLPRETVRAIAKRVAALRLADPVYRERHRAGCKRRIRSDAFIEQLRANIKIAQAALKANPEHEQRRLDNLGPGIRRSVAARFAWCPADYRPLYDKLSKSGFRAVEAKRMVLEQIAADKSRAARREAEKRNTMTPFERQLARVASGASRIYEMPRRAPALDGRS